MIRLTPRSTLCPYTTLFRSNKMKKPASLQVYVGKLRGRRPLAARRVDRFASIPVGKRLIDRGKERSTEMKRFLVAGIVRSEEHTSELQSRQYLVCRLLLEKK